jgi:signal transduction histidine kinase
MIIISLFIVLFKDYKSVSYVILVRKAIPYVVIYFIVTICSGFLKERYERNQARLREFVALLHQKNQKINEQHALLQTNYRELSHLNENLESIIAEKTRRIAEKNKQLASIAYAHAHQVRGPLARILGLLNLITLDSDKKDFYVCKIGEQALEMDETLSSVTKSIEGNIHK